MNNTLREQLDDRLAYEQYRELWASFSDEHKKHIKSLCNPNQMTAWKILNEWPKLRQEGER